MPLTLVSDRSSLCHTESGYEDGPMAGEGLRKHSFGEPLMRALRSPTKPRERHSISSSSDHGARSRSSTDNSADFPITPVAPIDRLASPEFVASDEEALSPLSGPLDISPSDLC